jgi:transcriptional regulator
MAITRIARHNFERIGNQLYFCFELQAKLDFNVHKDEEADE